VKHTPDAISKKRQELNRQIKALEPRIQSLSLQMPLTDKDKFFKILKLAAYKKQLEGLQAALKDTQKAGRRLNLDYSKSLHPGVM
jgi:chromosome segregation ATPase